MNEIDRVAYAIAGYMDSTADNSFVRDAARAAIAAMQESDLTPDGWHSIDTAPTDRNVLIRTAHGTVLMGRMVGGGWDVDYTGSGERDVIEWREVPE